MREALRHLFIINQHAGKKNAWKTVTEQLENMTIENLTVKYTSCRGDATRIAREFALESNEPARIFACGGDGTINEVVKGIRGIEHCAVAPVPIGSGNDFIRSFELPRESFLNLQSLISGETREIDLFSCGDNVSDNSISIGFDCAVAKNVVKFKRRKLISSSFAYKLSIFYCLLNGRKHNFKIRIDGKELENKSTYLLSIAAKGKYYGGGIKCSPTADNSDGLIDFMCIPTIGVFKFVSLLSTFVKGEHIDNPKLDFIFHTKCSRVEYISEEPTEIGVDGEIVPITHADIKVIPNAVKIVLPKAQP